jgi:multicomponent K+:H+ antiporter subunit D
MTKVGFYSICRVFAGIFGNEAGALANLAAPWIWPLAIATIAIGSVGVYSATSLRSITANMVIVSVGTLLLAFVIDGGQSLYVGFYYMLHSTIVTGALFLIADLIGKQRGVATDEIIQARPVNQATLLSGLFFAFAIAAIGLPPLSGFVGKALLLQSTCRLAEQVWVWPALLISSLTALVAFSRAGSTFFWHVSPKDASGGRNARLTQTVSISILLAATVLMTVFADSILTYSQGAARDIRKRPIITQQQAQIDRSPIHEKNES